MAVSKDVREIGQKAASLSAIAIVIRSLKFQGDASNVVPILKITGTQNAAALTEVGALLVTLYFLIRALDEWLADRYLESSDGNMAANIVATVLSNNAGERLHANLRLQGFVKWLISLIDFWLPIAATSVALVVVWPDLQKLVTVIILKTR